ncbi:hypothetical protein ADU88_05620 [Clostridium botulinum]|nr:hypothetical protein ADU88_05620 [Clostridium botulinum]
MATENKYPKYKNFNQRVLSPAVKELNETGNMEVVATEIKSGRKVSKIQFKILDREPKKYFKNLEAINSPVEMSDILLKDEIKPKEIVKTQQIVDNKIENILHIENRAVIKMINNKFKDYDFDLNKETIWECEIITLEKDNNIYDSINANNYKYFINTLANKINMEKENKDTFNDFPQRIYDFEDLEAKLLGIK